MDLLDHHRQEAGDEGRTSPANVFGVNRRRTPTLLLARLSASQTQRDKVVQNPVGDRMHPATKDYNQVQPPSDRAICRLLAEQIDRALPEAENKIWHGHPVWFLDGNPIVGYSKLKNCVRLLFWSGQSFDEEGLNAEGSFKAAEARYTASDQIDRVKLRRWLTKSRDIQWDYKNLVRRKGRLELLKQ
jgi:hypothetical protein